MLFCVPQCFLFFFRMVYSDYSKLHISQERMSGMGFNWKELDQYEEELELEKERHRKLEGFTAAHFVGLMLRMVYITVPIFYGTKILSEHFNIQLLPHTPSQFDSVVVGAVIGLLEYFRHYKVEKAAGENKIGIKVQEADTVNETDFDPIAYNARGDRL